jgi:hypothetical protein
LAEENIRNIPACSLAGYSVKLLVRIFPFTAPFIPQWLAGGGLTLLGGLLSVNLLAPLILAALTLLLCQVSLNATVVYSNLFFEMDPLQVYHLLLFSLRGMHFIAGYSSFSLSSGNLENFHLKFFIEWWKLDWALLVDFTIGPPFGAVLCFRHRSAPLSGSSITLLLIPPFRSFGQVRWPITKPEKHH